DGAWDSAVTGVGFSTGTPPVTGSSALVVRFNFDAAPVGNIIVDSKPSGIAHNGVNAGATWVASSTDLAPVPITRSGVMQFSAAGSSQMTLSANTDFNSTKGTIVFWMRSAGAIGSGNFGAMIMDRR